MNVAQISSRLQTALQRQIHYEYNKTATAINTTGGHDDDVIDHVTLTWDAMQTKVILQISFFCKHFGCILLFDAVAERGTWAVGSPHENLDYQLYFY